jgi:hypothetical protein
MPFRIYLQHLAYLFNAASAQSWEDLFYEGKLNAAQSVPFQTKPVEELYDTENDPWEVNNLAGDPAYKEVLERMRKENYRWMAEIKDVGLIPETQYLGRAGTGSMYDYMRSEECPFDELLKAAEMATSPGKGDIDHYVEYLKNKDAAVRYWGATGLLIHKEEAKSAIPDLLEANDEEEASTATLIAETLFQLGEKEAAGKIYVRILTDQKYGLSDRNFALNSIDAISFRTPAIENAVKNCYESQIDTLKGFAKYNAYDVLMSEYLLKQWGLIS